MNMREVKRVYRRRLAERMHPRLPLVSRIEVWNEEFLILSKGLRAARQQHLADVDRLIAAKGGDAFDKKVTEDMDAAQMKEEIESDLNCENAPDVWNGFGASTCLAHCFGGMHWDKRYGTFFALLDVLQGLIPSECEASNLERMIDGVQYCGWIKEMQKCVACGKRFEEYGFECRVCKKMIDEPKRCSDCQTRETHVQYACEKCWKEAK